MTKYIDLQMLRMQESDLNEVVAIEESVYSHPWTRNNFADTLSNHDDAWIARKSDGEMVGYFVHISVVDESHLLTIAVKRTMQGQGLGKFLLGKLVERALQLQLKSVILEVRASNIRACQLYGSFGFVLIGRRKNYYQVSSHQREDALIMQYQIS
jgi:ribosomal-protein-alanine N-acetyltransferase